MFSELLNHDAELSRQITRWSEKPVRHALAWLVARSGDSIFWIIVCALLIWQRHPLGWSLLLVVGVTALLTAVAKGVFRRERPAPKRAFSTDKYAFPSGHAARAAAVAITLSFGLPPYTLLWLLWALGVGLARVALSRHYLSDIVGGWLLGSCVSLILQLFL